MRDRPIIPPAPSVYVQANEQAFRQALARAFEGMLPTKNPYNPSNVTASRTLDATGASLAELRQVVGTLIQDLQSKGILS